MRPGNADSGELLAATGLVEGVVVALLHCRTHHPDHPRVQESVAKIGRFLKKLTTLHGTIELKAEGGCIHLEGKPLTGASLSAARLLDALRARRAEGLTFAPQAGTGDLLQLVRELALDPPLQDSFPAASARLAAAGCDHIRLLPASATPGLPGAWDSDSASPLGVYQGLYETLQDAVVGVGRGQVLMMGPAATAVSAAVEMLEASPDLLFETAGYEQFDPLGLGHSVRVCLLAVQVLNASRCDRGLLCRVGMAALFHDIGMAQVPPEIISCERPLTNAERAIIQQHPSAGASILAAAEGADPLSIAVAFGHHRGADGCTGYPVLPDAAPACPLARLVRICDIYEALTSPRPYKRKVSPTGACRILMEMGEQLDQSLLRFFLSGIGFFPPGQRVRLSDGCEARVVRPGSDPARPLVAVGKKGSERTLDLSLPETSLTVTGPM